VSRTPLSALVIADESITGVAERVDALPDDDEAAAELQGTGLAADGISLPADRGALDLARRIVARLRSRRLLEDLGQVGSSVELLGLHVPPGGRAALTLRRSATTDRQVSVKAMGFGFGDGRKLTIAIDEDIPERGACMRVIQHVVLHVRRFATVAEPLVTTDVVAWRGLEMVALPDCPHCGVRDDLDRLEFEEDWADALDTRPYDAPVTREKSYAREGSRKADVGIELPGKVAGGFHFELQTTITCSAKYTFPHGHLFVPYRRRGDEAILPYWATR
jgi:hypothetical protein